MGVELSRAQGWGVRARRALVVGGGGGPAWRGGRGGGGARRLVSLICETAGSQDLGWAERPLSEIERRHLGGWLTGESADVRVCAMPGPPRRLDAPDGCVGDLVGGGDLPAGADELAGDGDGH